MSARDAEQAGLPSSGTATRVTGAIFRFIASSKEDEGPDFAVHVGKKRLGDHVSPAPRGTFVFHAW